MARLDEATKGAFKILGAAFKGLGDRGSHLAEWPGAGAYRS